jgi:flagellar basal-body rod modification protein FlgD
MNPISEQVLDQLNARPPEERKRSGELDQEDFLELMLAQVKNQDPFEPMQNGEFIAQMAQFATVDGIQEMQKSIGSLNATMSSNQALAASSLVGRNVLAPGSAFELTSEGGVSGAFASDPTARGLVMNVHDATGALVARREIGASPDGLTRFTFDGFGSNGQRLPPGTYRIQGEALLDGSTVQANTLLSRRIDSVSVGAGLEELTLNLDGGESLGFDKVTEFQ